jgi:ABC-type transport system involved in cytochrome bd biosynthesis fused ATPase/permease subunit
MLRSVKAAIGYVAIVFGVGFLLGTLRVLVVAPQLGELLAVLIELPLMLATSWLVCGWIIHRFSLPGALSPRLVMGGVAFALLMMAEIGVSVFAFGRTVAQHFEAYLTAASLLGLLSQIAFALFPVLQLWVRRL